MVLIGLVCVGLLSDGAVSVVAPERSEAMLLSAVLFGVSFAWVPFVSLLERSLWFFGQGKPDWRRPSLSISPLARRKPLQFWYFCGLAALSIGSGALVRQLFLLSGFAWVFLPFFAAGGGLCLGCRVSLYLFSSCFTQSQETGNGKPNQSIQPTALTRGG